jgi:hypothetical protein
MKWMRIKLCEWLISLCDYGLRTGYEWESPDFFTENKRKAELKLKKLRGDV